MIEKLLNTYHPVRCIIAGPSESGKSVFLTNFFQKVLLNMINDISTQQVFINIYIKKYLNVLVIIYLLTYYQVS